MSETMENNLDLAPGASESGTDDEQKVLTTDYMIGVSDGLRYGINAEDVETILTDYTITHMPCVPDYVRGLINLRGQIMPVIDLRLRLGKPPADDCILMVVRMEGESVGILVDSMEKMVSIPNSIILPMPTQNHQKIISGMCSLPEGGTLLILDCNLLLHG